MNEQTLGDLRVRMVGGVDGQGGGDGPTVVLLHGFGAPGTDLVPLHTEIAAPPGTRFVFPEAPLLLPQEMGGGTGRAWWHIDIMRLQMAMMTGDARNMTHEVPDGLAEARAKVDGMLDALEAEHGMQPDRLVLGGFSQGAMLACDVALRSERKLAGLVLMSGTMIAQDEWVPLMPKRSGLRVVQSHGTDDPILPYAIAEQWRDELTKAGLQIEFVRFAGGHGIAPTVLSRVGELLGDVLS